MLAGIFLSGCQLQNPFQKQQDEVKPIDEPAHVDDHNQTQHNHKENPPLKQHPNDQELALEAAYFNEIKEVNGEKEILNPDNILALVNKTYSLPGTYIPADLVRPNVVFSFGNQDIEKSYLRKEAAQSLEMMFTAAKEEGIVLFASSGYRSYSRQDTIFRSEVERAGEEKAVQAVAIPGKSEHQTGLAMDITGESVNYLLTEEFGKKPEGIWLKKNAHRFGYILRYPKGKEGLTGYQYEPWHFRYVGAKAADLIYKKGWTLEEFFEQVRKI